MEKPFHLKIGVLGEKIAAEFLEKKGFKIIGKNYSERWGEIDIIATKNKILHFVEVKTVSHTTIIRPEENAHEEKIKRFQRTVLTYLAKNKISPEVEWVIDLVAIRLDVEGKKAYTKLIENIIL